MSIVIIHNSSPVYAKYDIIRNTEMKKYICHELIRLFGLYVGRRMESIGAYPSCLHNTHFVPQPVLFISRTSVEARG